MPRFDNEGFNPNRRIENDKRDRSVPDAENYYSGATPEDYLRNGPSAAEVKDNQPAYEQQGYTPRDYSAFERERYAPMQGGYAPRNELLSAEEYREQKEREEYARFRAQQREQRRAEKQQKPKRAPKSNAQKPPKQQTPAEKRKNRKRAVLAVLLALILILTGMVEIVLARIHYDEKKENPYIAAAEMKKSPLVKNILLLGVDARENQEKETSRPDTMMLVSFDLAHHCIKMTSFLRDTWVYVPSLEREQRLNASTGKDGYSGVVDTIEYNFGVEIDGYVVTNFEMFKVMVDAIGGVKVHVTKKEAREVNRHPGRYGKVKLHAGDQKLNGEQALAYCRIRKIDTDFNRTQRQRTVMTAILNKAKSNPFALYAMAARSAKYIETDLKKSELRSLAGFATYCVSGKQFQEKVPFEGTWEYANKGGASVIAINVEKNKEKLIDFIYHKTAGELTAAQKTTKE